MTILGRDSRGKGRFVFVACAIIEGGVAFLAARRGPAQTNPGLWEFPGGKVRTGETPETALACELREELGIEVIVGKGLTPRRHAYPWIAIELLPFICTICGGEPKPREHATIRWVVPSEARRLHWSAADVPILEEYAGIRLPPEPGPGK